jgi:hypothetical protein
VVLVASFTCLCVLDGVAYTFGVFLDPLLVEMGGGRGQISSAGPVNRIRIWYFVCCNVSDSYPAFFLPIATTSNKNS